MQKNLSYSLTPLADADMLNILLKGVEEWGVDQATSYAHKIHDTLRNNWGQSKKLVVSKTSATSRLGRALEAQHETA